MNEPARSALGAGAVVAHDQNDRVVELAEALDEVDHPPDLCVGVLEEAGEHLHHPRVQPPLVVAEVVPGLDPVRTLAQLRSRRAGGPTRLLAGEDLLAPTIPSEVELALVPVAVLLRDLMRRVACAGCEVEEERPLGRSGTEVLQVGDRVVGEILGEVVALLRRARRIDLMVVVHEIGVILIGLAGR